MTFSQTAEDYFRSPTAANLAALHDAICAAPGFDPYLVGVDTQLEELIERGEYRAIIDLIEPQLPGLFLSPSTHNMLRRAHRALGDDRAAQRELLIAQIALRTILDSGDGTAQAPYRVLRVRDEYDVLELLDKRPRSQSVEWIGASALDSFECDDQTTIYFLVEIQP